MLLTCECNDENDGDVNEEELEVSQVAENLQYRKWTGITGMDVKPLNL